MTLLQRNKDLVPRSESVGIREEKSKDRLEIRFKTFRRQPATPPAS